MRARPCASAPGQTTPAIRRARAPSGFASTVSGTRRIGIRARRRAARPRLSMSASTSRRRRSRSSERGCRACWPTPGRATRRRPVRSAIGLVRPIEKRSFASSRRRCATARSISTSSTPPPCAPAAARSGTRFHRTSCPPGSPRWISRSQSRSGRSSRAPCESRTTATRSRCGTRASRSASQIGRRRDSIGPSIRRGSRSSPRSSRASTSRSSRTPNRVRARSSRRRSIPRSSRRSKRPDGA